VQYVVRYAIVPGREADLMSVYPRHLAYLKAFEPADAIVAIGPLEDPVANGSMGIFTTADAARRFIADDPFVTEGLATVSGPLEWNVV
jgi:uncharacterized protein YciI